jgi:hypothetical protein
MKKILVYGDSFVAPYLYNHNLGWIQLLSKKLNLSEVNNAVRASSAEFCMKMFYNDIENNKINNGDIIILSLANPGRIHLEFQNTFPESASFYNAQLINYQDLDSPKNLWLKENKEHLDWYLTQMDLELININHSCYVHAIKNCADNYPDSVIILLSGWKLEKEIPLTNIPKNFLHLKIPLMDISNQEINNSSYFHWVSNCITDPRINHFSNGNLKIFTDLIYQSIIELDISVVTLDKFKKNIFPKVLTYEDYMHYIDQGDLTYFNEIVDNFKKIKHYPNKQKV